MVDKVSLQRKVTHKNPLFLGEEDFSVSETSILVKGNSSSPVRGMQSRIKELPVSSLDIQPLSYI